MLDPLQVYKISVSSIFFFSGSYEKIPIQQIERLNYVTKR